MTMTRVMTALFVAAATVAPAGWDVQTSGVRVRLRGVSAATDRIAWASGARGTVLRTDDAGATWRNVAPPDTTSLDFRDVDAVGSTSAYALSIGNGALSRIYKTTDAGATWTAQLTNADPKVFLDAMAFSDADHGVVIGDSVDGAFYVLTTSDGGRTWPRASGLPPALPNEGAFAASGTNVALVGRDIWIGTGAAAKARVLHSTDLGKTWAVAETPLAAGPSSGIFSIAFRDARHGVVVGGDYTQEKALSDNCAVTSDGGKTWTLVKGLSGFRSVVAAVPGTTGAFIAIGPSGSDWSDDDGRTWRTVDGPGFDTFSLAKPAGDGAALVGWAAGSGGRVAKLEIK